MEYRQRRIALQATDGVFIIPSWPEALRNPDVMHPYRPDSSLYYLTGFAEPESILVLTPKKSVLFVRPKDPEKELWEGIRLGVEGALALTGMDATYPIQQFASQLPQLLNEASAIYYTLGSSIDSMVLEARSGQLRKKGRTGLSCMPLHDPTQLIGELRIHKSASEIALLEKACTLSAEAHQELRRIVTSGMYEYELDAAFIAYTKKRGCERLGYPSIVAAGVNATILHYQTNTKQLKAGELVLVDAGAEYGMYTADISRTFAVTEMTQLQAKAYSIVLHAQQEGISMIKPGISIQAIHTHVCDILTEGMKELNLLKKDGAPFQTFYPHKTSHFLGLDVHDSGIYMIDGASRILEPGMVITVEPGLYIPAHIPHPLAGTGIRIEDDILIEASGHRNLTQAAEK